MTNLKDKLSGIIATLALVVALGVAIFGGGSTQTIVRETIKELGGTTNFDEVASGDALEFHKVLRLTSGVQFASWQNTTGSPIFIDTHSSIINKFTTTGTSSSFVLFSGTSSASTLTGGSGLSIMEGGGIYASGTDGDGGGGLLLENLPFGGIIDNLIYATSTMENPFASSTSIGATIGTGDSGTNDNNRNSSTTVIMVEPLDYVWLLLVSGDNEQPGEFSCSGAKGAGELDNQCETATSTTRGANWEVIYHLTATTTLNQ